MRTIGWLFGVVTLLSASSAFSQEPEPRCRVVRGARTEVVCDEITIEGASPRAYVVLGRTRDRYEAPALERRLAPEIQRTVRRAPF